MHFGTPEIITNYHRLKAQVLKSLRVARLLTEGRGACVFAVPVIAAILLSEHNPSWF